MPLRCSLLDILASLTGTIFSARDGKGEEERISTDDILGATPNAHGQRQETRILEEGEGDRRFARKGRAQLLMMILLFWPLDTNTVSVR